MKHKLLTILFVAVPCLPYIPPTPPVTPPVATTTPPVASTTPSGGGTTVSAISSPVINSGGSQGFSGGSGGGCIGQYFPANMGGGPTDCYKEIWGATPQPNQFRQPTNMVKPIIKKVIYHQKG